MHLLQPAVERFSKRFPRSVEKFTQLELAGVSASLGFSRLAQLVAESLGLHVLREPDDSDLLARNMDFEQIASVLGVTISERQIKTLITGDGLHLKFGADEIVAQADTPIQLVRPLTPMRDGAFCYLTSFTDQAIESRTVFETNEGLVPLVHPADAMLIYGIGQRSTVTKNDAHNLGILRQICDIDDPYLQMRANQVGADTRVWSFMAAAGQLAAAAV